MFKLFLNIFALLCLLKLTTGESPAPWNLTMAIARYTRHSGRTPDTQLTTVKLYKSKVNVVKSLLDHKILPDIDKFKMNLTQLVENRLDKNSQAKNPGEIQVEIDRYQNLTLEFITLLDRIWDDLTDFREEWKMFLKKKTSSMEPKDTFESAPCGGSLNLTGTRVKNLNFTLDEAKSCLWIIWTPTREKIYFDSIQVSGPGTLSLQYMWNPKDDSAEMRKILLVDKEFTVNSPMVYLTFTSKPSGGQRGQRTSFSLKVAPTGPGPKQLVPPIQFLPMLDPGGNNTEMEFSYPGNGVKYKDNEMRVFVLQPPPNESISLTMQDVQMQTYIANGIRCCDFLWVYTYSTSYNQFVAEGPGGKFGGAYEPPDGEPIVSAPGQPLLLLFKANHCTVNWGFKFTWKHAVKLGVKLATRAWPLYGSLSAGILTHLVLKDL